MARYNQRPENALKRANEFIEVGKPARALDTLQEVFRNKKWNYTWSELVLEPIMFKYLDLCVELKKSHIAKEGLFQYRNIFQSLNVASLENVIRGYLRSAEERTENAKDQSAQAVCDIDDLDNLATPESILLSAVSGEDAQDRSDRTILTPWVKFLWESYCQCLELLRTNAHVENLYHDIAKMAFQFCLKYNRKAEFRKLCEKLRKHLEDICKLPAQMSNVSISKPETQQLSLETRLHQLEYASQMELWQEAYKAIEDIHNLMNISKKMPLPKIMATYYMKLATIFWKAGNNLFHAAALFKLFQLSKEMRKSISQEELQRMACTVLLATLSIPLPSAHPEFDRFIETDKSPLEKAQKLAVLLGLSQPPTRASLIKELVRLNVINLASPQLLNLYQCLEIDFDPLHLCERVHSTITVYLESGADAIAGTTVEGTTTPSCTVSSSTNTELQQYIPALKDVTLMRLIRQVAQIYQTIHVDRLLQLARFTDVFHLERLLVDCVRHNDMQIRIDHSGRCIHFGMDLSESQRVDKPDGPTLQVMPSEQVRNQLVNMATVLHQAVQIISPNERRKEREQQRQMLVQHYHENKEREHHRILQRHKIIEDRKEYIERLNTVREEEEQRRQEEAARQIALAEQKRLEQEREEREKKRALNEIQEIRNRQVKEKLLQFSQTDHGQRVLKKLDEEDIKKLDADQIAAKEAEELQKEKRELQAKLKSQEKKVDYFERAKRLEEIPLLVASLKDRQERDKQFWEQQEDERIKAAIEERELAVATSERFQRMRSDKDCFLHKLTKERNIVYEDKLDEFNKRLDELRQKRLLDRKLRRKEERRANYVREKQERAERQAAEQRQREEEERENRARQAAEEKAALEAKERERREQREREFREQREQREREHREMLERCEAKKRQRMEEVDRRLQEDNMRAAAAAATMTAATAATAAADDSNPDQPISSWRRAEKVTVVNEEPPPQKPVEPWRPRNRTGTRPETTEDPSKPSSDSWRRREPDESRERFAPLSSRGSEETSSGDGERTSWRNSRGGRSSQQGAAPTENTTTMQFSRSGRSPQSNRDGSGRDWRALRRDEITAVTGTGRTAPSNDALVRSTPTIREKGPRDNPAAAAPVVGQKKPEEDGWAEVKRR